MTDITLPEDTTPSRLAKSAPKGDALDDVATAGERIEAFWERYPDGSILTEIEPHHNAEILVSIYTVRAFVRKNGDAERPDATAHATRSTADPDAITAQFPQETAETSAISRALRNLGILAVSRPAPPAAPPADTAPAPAERAPSTTTPTSLATARQASGMTQNELMQRMRVAGQSWTQATVSKIERGKRAITADEAKVLASILPSFAP